MDMSFFLLLLLLIKCCSLQENSKYNLCRQWHDRKNVKWSDKNDWYSTWHNKIEFEWLCDYIKKLIKYLISY